LKYREGVTELAVFDELPTDGDLIYSETEGQVGTPIQGYVECVCSDCDLLEGACCYTFRGARYCEVTDKGDCYSSHAGQDPEYWGNGTCCQQAGTDCDSDNPDSILCTDPDNADCLLYTGLCYDQNGIETTCGENGNASGCASTYTIAIGFPELTTYSGMGGNNGSICPPTDCVAAAGDNTFCCIDSLEGQTAHTVLTKTAQNEETWESDGYVDGGTLGGEWHKEAGGLASCCDSNSGACQTCNPTIGGGQYAPCINGIDDWDCPCCAANKYMAFQYSAWISNVSTHGNPSHSGYCVPPCNTYAIDIRYAIGVNGCFGDTDCGACPNDCVSDPDGICYYTSYWVRYFVARPLCGCPAGLSSGDANQVYVLNGSGQVDDLDRCYHGCGCDKWTTLFGNVKVRQDEIIQGMTWSIS
jgi:hypothetical protein